MGRQPDALRVPPKHLDWIELKKAEMAADNFDGLGAPMTDNLVAYRDVFQMIRKKADD